MKKFFKKFSYIFFLLIFINNPLFSEGFISGTSVKTPSGYNSIEKLKPNDEVISYDLNGTSTCSAHVTEIRKTKASKLLGINVLGDLLCTVPNQKFFSFADNSSNKDDPFDNDDWLTLEDKNLKTLFDCNYGVNVENILIIEDKNEFDIYTLTVDPQQNFFVTNHDILVHNWAFTIPILKWTIGQGIKFVTLSTLTLLAIKLGLKKAVKKAGGDVSGYNLNTASPDPKDPKDDDEDEEEWKPLTNKEAREKAKEWGYEKDKDPPFNSHGRPAFKKGRRWISPDADGHNGGVWKEIDKDGRLGTLDKNGNKIKG